MVFPSRFVGLLCAIVIVLAAALPAHAADDIGATVRIVNKVTADLAQQVRTLSQGDPVRQNEVIAVEKDALGELKLLDDTKLALGPGSKLTLDKFVYDPAKAKGTVDVNLVKGAFRFVTGVAKKNSYTVKTPSASISVRGTVFDIYVDDDGNTYLLLHEGAIDVCNKNGEACRPMRKMCNVTRVANTGLGVVGIAGGWKDQTEPRNFSFETAFPFVINPPTIDPVTQHTQAAVEANDCPKNDEAPVQQRAAYPEPAAPSPPVQVAQAPAAKPAPETYEPAPEAPLAPLAPVIGVMWNGPYAGVVTGYGTSNPDTRVGCDDPGGVFDTVFGTPNCGFPIESGALETSYDLNPDGGFVGTTAGFNVNLGGFVAGFETDISKAEISDDIEVFKNVPPTSPGYRRLSQELEWFGTARGRLGYAFGNVLVYSTAGLAYGRSTYHYDSLYPLGNATANVTSRDWKVGWTTGAGTEIAIGNVSFKAEYLYYDLGDEDLRTQFFIFGNTPTPVYFEPHFETKGSLARVGVNFRLN